MFCPKLVFCEPNKRPASPLQAALGDCLQMHLRCWHLVSDALCVQEGSRSISAVCQSQLALREDAILESGWSVSQAQWLQLRVARVLTGSGCRT